MLRQLLLLFFASISTYTFSLYGMDIPLKGQAIEEPRFHFFGTVEPEKTKLHRVSSALPVKVEKLYLSQIGSEVKEGEQLAKIFSPQLVAIQEELIESLKSLNRLKSRESRKSYIQSKTLDNINLVRKKMVQWGISETEINEIEDTLQTKRVLTLVSPIGGEVLDLPASEGEELAGGSPIITIGQLDTVSVKLEAHLSDLELLEEGQEVEFTTVNLPNKQITGVISSIDRKIDPRSHTASVLVSLNNKEEHLRPGSFLRGKIRAKTTEILK